MNSLSRGFRNAFRNYIRTVSIVLILGLSVGMALSMLVARHAVQTKIENVKSSIGNTISISPAGVQGFQGGGDLLTTDQLLAIKNISHVQAVRETLNDRLTTDNTNLVSAIEAGSFGRRQAGNSGVGFQAPRFMTQDNNGGTVTRTFTPPVLVTGTDTVADNSVFGGDSIKLTAGAMFDPATTDYVAVVGKDLASKNNLSAGSTYTAYGQTVKVVGIYDAGNTFANANAVMPLAALQKLSSQDKQVNNATVTVDSIDNIDAVTSTIKSNLGDKADVTNNQENAKQTVQPLQNVKSISTYSLFGAIIAGAIILLMTMVMIVRERRREIGVMKAIGATNYKTVTQFVAEAVTLTGLSLAVGLIIGIAAAQPVTRTLVNNSADSSSNAANATFQRGAGPVTFGAGQGPRFVAGGRGLRGFGNNNVNNIRNVKASISPAIVAYGIGVALLIAVIGSAVPAYIIGKIRPAEVLRAE